MVFIKFILAVVYLLRLFLYEDKESHVGPFPSDTDFVFNEATNHYQSVSLFDRIRRLTPFNPYVQHGDKWHIDPNKIQVWTCPTCLSFWLTFIVTIPLFITSKKDWTTLFNLIVLHFAISGGSSIMYELTERTIAGVQLWEEETDDEDDGYARN